MTEAMRCRVLLLGRGEGGWFGLLDKYTMKVFQFSKFLVSAFEQSWNPDRWPFRKETSGMYYPARLFGHSGCCITSHEIRCAAHICKAGCLQNSSGPLLVFLCRPIQKGHKTNLGLRTMFGSEDSFSGWHLLASETRKIMTFSMPGSEHDAPDPRKLQSQ